MGGIFSQILFCLIFGYAGTFLGMSMYTLLGMIYQTFPDQHMYFCYMAFMTISFFFAWVQGAVTYWMDEMNGVTRGLLVTLFLNASLLWSYMTRYAIKKVDWHDIPLPLAVFFVINTLIAIYSSRSFETLFKIDPKKGKEKNWALASLVLTPFLMVGLSWGAVYGIIFLVDRYQFNKWLAQF